MNHFIRRLRFLAAVPLAAACATGAAARGAGNAGDGGLAPGRSVTGRLTPADPQFRDGSYYRRYDFTARQGDTLTFALTSDDFDAYLILTDRFGNPVSHDDDGGDQCNAQLTYVVRTTGRHRLYANSSARAEVGEYRLSVSRGPGRAVADSTCRGFGRVAGMIRLGETVAGELTADDPMFSSDSTYYQRWILLPTPGQAVTIDLESDAFDAYVLLTSGRGETLDKNDDGGAGLQRPADLHRDRRPSGAHPREHRQAAHHGPLHLAGDGRHPAPRPERRLRRRRVDRLRLCPRGRACRFIPSP